jgi:hypothetical protein
MEGNRFSFPLRICTFAITIPRFPGTVENPWKICHPQMVFIALLFLLSALLSCSEAALFS